MKKSKLLLFALFVVSAGFFSSCEEESDPAVSISLAGDAGYTSSNATVEPGAAFKVKWTATSTSDMAYVSILRDDIAISSWDMLDIDSDYENTYIDEATITAPASGGPYRYSIVFYDDEELELGRKEIVISLQAAAGGIATYTDLDMGAKSVADIGSYLDAESGTVYKSGALSATVKAKIDVVFDLGKLFNTASLITGGTGAKFASTTITGTQFNAMSNDASFSTLTASLNDITVAAGDVVFFTTKAGKKGLIKVNSLTNATATGVLNIDIKIQQ